MIFFKRKVLLLSQIWRCVEVVTCISVGEILCSDLPFKIFSTVPGIPFSWYPAFFSIGRMKHF